MGLISKESHAYIKILMDRNTELDERLKNAIIIYREMRDEIKELKEKLDMLSK